MQSSSDPNPNHDSPEQAVSGNPGADTDSEPTPADSSNGDPFAHAPISKLVGFQVLPARDSEPGQTVVIIDCDHRHHNPMGRVHGGLVAALADAAMGIAFGRTLELGQDFSTIEIKLNFMRPVTTGRLQAKAWVIERGLRIGFVECHVIGPRNKIVATATSTCTVVSSI